MYKVDIQRMDLLQEAINKSAGKNLNWIQRRLLKAQQEELRQRWADLGTQIGTIRQGDK